MNSMPPANSHGEVIPDLLVDATDLLCPLPVLKTRKAIGGMQPGQLLAVSTKDAMAKSDIIYLAQRLALELVDVSEEDGMIRIAIKK